MRETPINRLWMKGRTGKNANNWKGDKAGYHAIHLWLTANYKKPEKCEQCGSDKFSRLEWANISGEYKRERDDYRVMCPRCHRLFDMKNKCRKGHEFTTETTLTNIRGHRHCKICKKEREVLNATRNKVQTTSL